MSGWTKKRAGWETKDKEPLYRLSTGSGIRDNMLTEAEVTLAVAAPDLLEALQSFVDEGDGCIQACGNGGEDPEECSPLCAKVRRAIVKAKVSP